MKKSIKLKQLRKQILALSLAGSMAFGVTGCGNTDKKTSTDTDAKQEVTTQESTTEEVTTQEEVTNVDGLTLYDDTEEKEKVNNAVNNYKNKKGKNTDTTDPNTTVTTNSDGSKVQTRETTEALDPHVGTTESGNSNSTTTTGSSSTGTQTTTEVLPEEVTTEEPKPVDYDFGNNKDAREADKNKTEKVTVEEKEETSPSLPNAPKVDYNYDKQESTTQEQTTQEEVIEYEDYEEDDEFILPPLPEDDITSKSNKTYKLVMRG